MSKGILRRLRRAHARAIEEMSRHDGSLYAAGFSCEGYVGGYAAALRDVEAALTHGSLSDDRGFWREDEADA